MFNRVRAGCCDNVLNRKVFWLFCPFRPENQYADAGNHYPVFTQRLVIYIIRIVSFLCQFSVSVYDCFSASFFLSGLFRFLLTVFLTVFLLVFLSVFLFAFLPWAFSATSFFLTVFLSGFPSVFFFSFSLFPLRPSLMEEVFENRKF